MDTPHTCKKDSELSMLHDAIIDIKDTLRDLKDLLISNAVLEKQSEQFRKDIDALFSRLNKLEVRAARASGSSIWVERVVWALICAALAGLGILQP